MEPIWKWKFCHLARQLHSKFNLAREGWTCQDHLGGCSEDYQDALLSFTLQHHREQSLHFKAAMIINFLGAGRVQPNTARNRYHHNTFSVWDSKARQKTAEHPFHRDVCKLTARQSLRRGVMEAEGSGLTGAQTRRLLLWGKHCWVFKSASICALLCVWSAHEGSFLPVLVI